MLTTVMVMLLGRNSATIWNLPLPVILERATVVGMSLIALTCCLNIVPTPPVMVSSGSVAVKMALCLEDLIVP